VIEIPVGAVVVTVPPQIVALALPTVSPVGNVSVNATPVSDTAFATGFVIVKVSDVVAPTAIPVGVKALAMDGGATTSRLAVFDVAPVPPSVEATALVVFALVPGVVPVTLIEKAQLALAAIVPPVRLMTLVADDAVIVPAPQVPVSPLGVAIVMPAGRLSVNATPVNPMVVLAFVTVNESEVEPFSGTLAAPKDLEIVGGPATVIDAFEVLPVPASVEVIVTLLFFMPAVVPVTLSETTQEALGASVAPERESEAAPATAVAVPEQVLARLEGVATTRPAGKLSVNARPVSEIAFDEGFVTVNERLVDPFKGIAAAPNALVIVGGAATLKLALAVLPVPPLVDVTAPVVFV